MTTARKLQLIRVMRAMVVVALAGSTADSLFAQSAQERLAASVKDAGGQIQNTRADLQDTIGALNDLRNQKGGDLRPAYDKFSESVEKTRNSAGQAANLYATMSADSKNYFASWQSEVDGISNPDIKKASAKRLKTVQKEYDNVVKELKPIQPLFNPMMSDLDDLKKALGTDLTPAGLKALSKSIDKTNKSLTKFQGPIVKSMTEFDKMSASLTPAAQ